MKLKKKYESKYEAILVFVQMLLSANNIKLREVDSKVLTMFILGYRNDFRVFICKKLGIKETTFYSSVKRLITSGFIVKDADGNNIPTPQISHLKNVENGIKVQVELNF